jgi:hypothetical protein
MGITMSGGPYPSLIRLAHDLSYRSRLTIEVVVTGAEVVICDSVVVAVKAVVVEPSE